MDKKPRKDGIEKIILRRISKQLTIVRESWGEPNGIELINELNKCELLIGDREQEWNKKAWKTYKGSDGKWGWPRDECRISPLRRINMK